MAEGSIEVRLLHELRNRLWREASDLEYSRSLVDNTLAVLLESLGNVVADLQDGRLANSDDLRERIRTIVGQTQEAHEELTRIEQLKGAGQCVSETAMDM